MPPRKQPKNVDATNPDATTATTAAEETEPAIQSYSLTVPLPDQPGASNFLVEFPGYIKNEERALATFGGLDGLAAQRQTHPKTLHLRLRPGDPSCHPLISDDAKPASVLVLKLTRSNQKSLLGAGKMHTDDPDSEEEEAEDTNGNDSGVNAEIVAVATKTYAFSAPADFQYVGQDRRPFEIQWVARSDRVEDDPEFLPIQPLLCTPPIFAVEPAVDYGFKQYKAADYGLDVLGRKPKRGTGITWVDYFAKDVPSADTKTAGTGDATTVTTGPDGQDGQRGGAIEALLAHLELLFSRRPVYLESALGLALKSLDVGGAGTGITTALAATERGTVASTLAAAGAGGSTSASATLSSFPATRPQQELLSKLCYRFKNGPWKGTWVLRGYDPRAEPAARQYQVLEYSLPVEWWKKVIDHKNKLNKQLQQLQLHNTNAGSSKPTLPGSSGSSGSGLSGLPPVAANYSALCSFSGVPSTQTLQLQLCDINDSEIRSVLADTSNVSAEVSDDSGWLTQAAWQGIKSTVALHYGALWEAAAAAAQASKRLNRGGTGGSTAATGTGTSSIGIIPPELMSELATYLEKGQHSKTTAAGSGGGKSRGAAAPEARGQQGAVEGTLSGGDVHPVESNEAIEEEEEDEDEDDEEEVEVGEEEDEEDDDDDDDGEV